MSTLAEMLDEARLGDPDEPIKAARIEHAIYEELRGHREMPFVIPAVAIKTILLERLKRKGKIDELSMYLGNWLIEVDQSRDTLELLASWFKGTPIESVVQKITTPESRIGICRG